MVTQTLRSQSPYYDDFDPTKDFIQVLFRPGYPVQARELTTLQTFLQEQIGRFGGNYYKTGDLVKNAEITFNDDVHELVISSSSNLSFPGSGAITNTVLANLKTLEGKIITNADESVKARVLPLLTGTDSTKFVGNIYVQYLTEKTFDSDGGYIYAMTSDNSDEVQSYWSTFSTLNEACTVSIAEGLFFVEGVFAKVQKQSILISNSTQKPSFNVGLYFDETIVTQNDDPSLFDNARGSSNEGAPGAHRLKFTLTLGKKDLSDPIEPNFYRLATFLDGVRQEQPKEVDVYLQNILEILARRTYDESGDYALKPFKCTHTEGDSENNFLINVGPSKAYVKGWEIDKTSPTNVYMDRGFTNTKLTKNFSIPAVGTTSVTITGVTGTLPGSTTSDVFNATNRLLLRAGGQTIGVARGWAVKDEFKKGVAATKLYLYDIRMFDILTTTEPTFATSLATGYDVVSLKTRGTVFTEEGATGVVNGVAIVNATGKFRVNQTISSSVLDSESTIASVTSYQLADVTDVTSAGGFSATVVAGTVENETASLLVPLEKHLKTLKDGSTNIMDNDFYVIEDKGGAATTLNAANGNYDQIRVDDITEITKTLKYSYLKIANARGTSNYGWTAVDKEVSLHYPDVHRVYRINESTDNTFNNGRFERLKVITAGVIPQGAVVTGVTSGNKAVIALQNSNTINEQVLSGTTGYHHTQTGTGTSDRVEVVFTKGTSFQANELLTVEVPAGVTEYTFQVEYISSIAEVGDEITGSFMVDSGQRKEYYDIGRLVRKENVPSPNNDIIVFFSYFEADATTSHYYSVDSYAAEDFLKVDPRYYGVIKEIKPKLKDDGIDLRNAIDFRLRVNEVTDITKNPFNFASRSFHDQDRVVPDTKFTTDFYEYLPRIDLISLEKTGDIITLQGIPSLLPQKPQVSIDGMPLFWVHIPPAVRYPEAEIHCEVVDNRRYTMRDIGDLDRRINRLEETVSLTMLESQALHDDISGRTKSGFVVDDFSLAKDNPNSPSDPAHPEYNASVDVLNRQLLPSQTAGVPIETTVSSTTNISTFFSGYYMNAFTEEAFSTQMEATTSQLINPFATWSFYGDIELTPSEDNWRIRKDEYFTELYGELKPFEGSAADFQNFSRITTASPGGVSTTVKEWIGQPKTTSAITGRDNKGRHRSETRTTTTTQSQRSTTTVTFDKPRVIEGTTPITTQTGTQVIENVQDYYMRSITVSFAADNLRPNTDHDAYFGTNKVLTSLTTDADGTLTGSFTIPAQTYKAGTQTFELKDTTSAGLLSAGAQVFKSIGHLDTFRTTAQVVEQTTSVTTAANVVKSQISETRRWRERKGDPIAQMFMLPNDENGVQSSIITSIDLWLSKVDTRTAMSKIKVEIRKSANGYPGGNKDIIGSTGFVTVASTDEVTTISNSNGKNFKFKEPVVLRGDTEYAIVIKTPSDIMSVWVAEIGQPTIDGTGIHSDQPNVGGYYGSFFVSQNASTWNAEQSKDLTYRLKRAKFDTATNGNLTLVNTVQDANYHKGDIGAFNQGLAMETFNGSQYVRVYHPNHGFHYNNAQVTISGVDSSKTYNGLNDSDLNGTFDVLYSTLNTYMIKALNNKATVSGKINTGIWTTFATQDIMFDSMLTNFMFSKEETDSVAMTIKSTVTSPINLTVANNKIANSSIITPYADTATSYEYDKLIEFEEPRIVRSATNSTGTDLTVNLSLSSGTDYTSPILKNGTNLQPIVFRNLTGYMLNDSEIEGLTQRVSDSDDNIDQEYVSYIQAVQSELEHSAYVTDQIDLEIPADGFTVFFDAVMKPGTQIVGAYKVRQLGDDTPFDELEWQDLPYAQQVNESNYGDFSSEGTRKSIEMRTETPFEFTSFKFRFRLKTENEAYLPRMSELRIICDI